MPDPSHDHSDPLAAALATLGRGGRFCTRRYTTSDALALDVVGVGRVALPVTEATAERIVAMASVSPFGWRDQTLVDPSVRCSYEVPSQRMTVDEARFGPLLHAQLAALGADLGLPGGGKMDARLDKLVLYGPGQFFRAHQDTEKRDTMIGTLVIVLPSTFTGGAVRVEQHGTEVLFEREANGATELEWLAFYADCRHEVRVVESGVRAVLVFELLYAPAEDTPPPQEARRAASSLGRILAERFDLDGDGVEECPPEKLVVLLDHEYTRARLGWQHLKGPDRARAEALRLAAAEVGLAAHLALAVNHEVWQCVPASQRYRARRGSSSDSDYEVDFLVDRNLHLTAWCSDGERATLSGDLEVREDELVFTRPTDAGEPVRSEYEGFMGNYGETLQRWYERAAVVLWPLDTDHLVRAQSSPILVLEELVARFVADGPDADAARCKLDVLLERWPEVTPKKLAPAEELVLLSVADALRDDDAAARLLDEVDIGPPREEHIAPLLGLAARYGADWVADRVKGWYGGRRYRSEWRKCTPDLLRAWIARGAADGRVIAARFANGAATDALSSLQHEPPYAARSPYADARLAPPLADLARALEMAAVAGQLEQVHALLGVLAGAASPFSPLQSAEVLVSIREGLAQDPFDASNLWPATATLREALAAALAITPRSATDQRIAVPIACKCELCATLRTFLGSNERELVWPLSAERRRHVEDSLRRACLPIDAAVRKVGSPHKLVLTKRTLELSRIETERREAMARTLSALQ
jgi:hypothetical protein